MEVTTLGVRLLMSTLMLLVAEEQPCYCAETAGGALLRVVPNRLQFFEYDSISFTCEGYENSIEWRLMRKVMGVKTICASRWNQSRGPCFIEHAFESDSGEYWCEAQGKRSNSVNINVTAGSVILESPALPVPEGGAVTLSCKTKTTSGLRAKFYKDGVQIQTGYEGNMIIHSVSKSDEGLYKCDIISVGKSAVSRLTVRDTHPSLRASSIVSLLWIIVSVFLLTLPVLVVGLCLCANHRGLSHVSPKTSTARSCSGETDTVSEVTNVVHLQMTTCSPNTAPRRTTCSRNTESLIVTEAAESSVTATPDIDTPSADTDQCPIDENTFYYTIT